MRLFVALRPDPDVRSWIAGEQARLRKALARFEKEIRWLRPESIHLTLSFLGEIADAVAVEQALARCRLEPVRLEWQGVGVFPSRRHPSVLWIGLADPSGGLARLQGEVAAAMAAFVEPERRRFAPHLTVARISPRAGAGLGPAIESIPPASGGPPWLATGFSLMRSDLSPAGARYTVVRDF